MAQHGYIHRYVGRYVQSFDCVRAQWYACSISTEQAPSQMSIATLVSMYGEYYLAYAFDLNVAFVYGMKIVSHWSVAEKVCRV